MGVIYFPKYLYMYVTNWHCRLMMDRQIIILVDGSLFFRSFSACARIIILIIHHHVAMPISNMNVVASPKFRTSHPPKRGFLNEDLIPATRLSF